MNSHKHVFKALILTILVLTIYETTYAKSVYVINDTGSSEMQAYKVEDANLVYQTDYHFVSEVWGPVGLAIDESGYGQFLFATFESKNEIELINAKTMQYVDTVTAPQANNLAGIVVDKDKSKVYIINRETNHLYVYSWNRMTKELTLDFPSPYYVELQDCFQGYGLALDYENDRLYVADNTTTVKCYDANDPNWSKLEDFCFTITDTAVGIAIDVENQYVYTGASQVGSSNYLTQYNLTTETQTRANIGTPVLGIAVDQDTGLIYLTTYGDGGDTYYPNPPEDRLMIYDSNLTKQPWESGDIGNPAGVAVGSTAAYKPPAFYFDKVDVNEPNCVLPGDYITYKISYGPNGLDHNNVRITDYLPCQVDYINPFDPNYDDVNRTYTWQIGSLSASAPNDLVTLTVYVNLGVEPNGIITNYCEIESDHYCSFAFADTNACFWSPDILYVDVNAVGCGSGLSWEHADPDLQSALWKAQAWDVNQIRVAEGTYEPTKGSVRSISFELLDDIAIYGGFPSGGGQWADRDPNAHQTILSGDIGTPNDLSDNSYHVVKSVDINNAILDGFIIIAGYADAAEYTDPDCRGGGIYNDGSSSLMIANCTFGDNSAVYGGAIYNNDSSSDVNVTNCVFTGNNAILYGGGIYNYYSSPAVTNCAFSENLAVGDNYNKYCGCGGGIANNERSSPVITNCTFSGNSALYESGIYGKGGGIYNKNGSHPPIKYCIFIGNFADANGGGIYNHISYLKITNCIFSGNKASSDSGGGIYNSYSEPNITNCILTGNTAEHNGGGICNYKCTTSIVTNCTFSGNRAEEYGGGTYNWDSPQATLSNCIFWDNDAGIDGTEIYNNSNLSVTYCDVKEGGWEGGGDGNINEDPSFFEVDSSSGSWSDNASYDSSTFQSTLTDSYANWAVNELAGRFVNPDTNQNLQFLIVSNGVNTIKVWSDVESIATNGKPYRIYDYHLISGSPCIDAGYPEGDYAGQTDIDGEPRVFDGDANETEIVDMGADEYYWSPADFNSDGLVNFFDYALIAGAWLTIPTDQYYNDICDLIDNNCIDYNDLARFCEDWLWQTAWAKTFPFAYGQTMGRGLGMSQAVSESFVVTQVPYPSVLTKEAQPEVIEVDIEVIVKWLFELWLTNDEVRKMISEDEWLKFIESVIQSSKE